MFFLILLLILLPSCRQIPSKGLLTCRDCHKVETSSSHNLSCPACHDGTEKAKDKRSAHQQLRRNPSANRVITLCQKCHPGEVENFRRTLHYTYQRESNLLLKGFWLNLRVNSLLDLLSLEEQNLPRKEALILDFLRKRCFTCHIFSEGENYPAVHRGRGCLACHRAHLFTRPKDDQCLACHNGIRIGIDYYGQTPHPWFSSFRSPFFKGKLPGRPYGIEYHPLTSDVHASHGFTCISCHRKEEIMEGKAKSSCQRCHQQLFKKGGPFHQTEILKQVDCVVCHAQFLNQDELKVCKMVEGKEVEEFSEVFVQESAEVENYFLALNQREKPEEAMKDGLTDLKKKGLWLCLLEGRTFESFLIERGKEGKFCLIRQEKVKLQISNSTLWAKFKVCKTPHTLGKGDLIRSLEILNRLKGNLGLKKWDILRLN